MASVEIAVEMARDRVHLVRRLGFIAKSLDAEFGRQRLFFPGSNVKRSIANNTNFKKFFKLNNQNFDLATVRDNGKAQCVYCNRKLSSRRVTTKHIRAIHDGDPLKVVCECGQSFTTKGNLVKHRKTAKAHKAEEPPKKAQEKIKHHHKEVEPPKEARRKIKQHQGPLKQEPPKKVLKKSKGKNQEEGDALPKKAPKTTNHPQADATELTLFNDEDENKIFLARIDWVAKRFKKFYLIKAGRIAIVYKATDVEEHTRQLHRDSDYTGCVALGVDKNQYVHCPTLTETEDSIVIEIP